MTRAKNASKFKGSEERLGAPSSLVPTNLVEAKGENRHGWDIATATVKNEVAAALAVLGSFIWSCSQSDGGSERCSACRLT